MELKKLQSVVKNIIDDLKSSMNDHTILDGEEKFKRGACQILSRSPIAFTFLVEEKKIQLNISSYLEEESDEEAFEDPEEEDLACQDDEKEVIYGVMPDGDDWDSDSYACLLEMQQLLKHEPSMNLEHKKYSRQGMIERVMDERRQKALHAEYRIKWAGNIYGDHILTNEKGVKYTLFLRDFDNETGYSNSKDAEINKLGTTKHLMFAFATLKENPGLYRRLRKKCPFVEVFCDPLNDYKISYFYPHMLDDEVEALFQRYFNPDKVFKDNKEDVLIDFLREAEAYNHVVIRPEVHEKLSRALEEKSLQILHQSYTPDFSCLNANLYDYQEEGIRFALFRKHAIIADEMGLGKTLQAIGTAVLKKEIFGFTKTLVVCPASLKEQWKKEIEKFTNERAEVISGNPKERAKQYIESEAYFIILNYETVLRDQVILKKARFDYLILDEAQRVKNYATKTASAIKNVGGEHVLIITGTPIENKLIDLFSLMSILNPHLLGPLWEFSYQHCLFDVNKPNKINAYYNLNNLKNELKQVLLRREKRKVIEQLPNIQQQDIPIKMTSLQEDYHASYARAIGQITNKKFMTTYDMQRLQQLLAAMRMVCDSTYLVDEATNESPKLDELKYILVDKLDIKNTNRKVIIFSEWVKMHKLIGQMLLESGVGFSELNGSVPVKKRGELIKQFEEEEDCKVFLSTEAGGSGLNLQVADILINFELPWNPAKKNQRIGRIDRLGQKSDKLTIFNLVTTDSIEQRISLGLLVKQNLFDSVLNEGLQNDFVDFTEKGRGQFLQQMKELAGEFEEVHTAIVEEEYIPVEEELKEYSLEDFKKDHPEQYEITFEEDTEERLFSEEDVDVAEPNHEVPTEEIVSASDTVKEGAVSTSEPSQTQDGDSGNQEKVAAEKMEEVLNSGMQFLSGLMQMATGKSVAMEDQKIEVNKETGEVTMKFKMPKMF